MVTADAVVVACGAFETPRLPAAQRRRQLVGSRRPVPDVPPADDRARVLPVPGARVQGARRHPPHGRSDRGRRRHRRRGARGRAAVPPGRHRRARWERPSDHGGGPPSRGGRALGADGRLTDTRQDGRVHDARRRPAAGDEPGRPRSRACATCGGFPPAGSRIAARARRRVRAPLGSATGGRCCAVRARTARRG